MPAIGMRTRRSERGNCEDIDLTEFRRISIEVDLALPGAESARSEGRGNGILQSEALAMKPLDDAISDRARHNMRIGFQSSPI
jgi:hypothetical protein